MTKRRPPTFDLIAFLLEHPEYCDASVSEISRAIGGKSHETILYQLGKAIHEGRAYLRTIIVPKRTKSVKKSSSKKLKEMSSVDLVDKYFTMRLAKRNAQRELQSEESKAYHAAYMAEWKKDPENRAKLNENKRRFEAKKKNDSNTNEQ